MQCLVNIQCNVWNLPDERIFFENYGIWQKKIFEFYRSRFAYIWLKATHRRSTFYGFNGYFWINWCFQVIKRELSLKPTWYCWRKTRRPSLPLFSLQQLWIISDWLPTLFLSNVGQIWVFLAFLRSEIEMMIKKLLCSKARKIFHCS